MEVVMEVEVMMEGLLASLLCDNSCGRKGGERLKSDDLYTTIDRIDGQASGLIDQQWPEEQRS